MGKKLCSLSVSLANGIKRKRKKWMHEKSVHKHMECKKWSQRFHMNLKYHSLYALLSAFLPSVFRLLAFRLMFYLFHDLLTVRAFFSCLCSHFFSVSYERPRLTTKWKGNATTSSKNENAHAPCILMSVSSGFFSSIFGGWPVRSLLTIFLCSAVRSKL